MNERRTQKDSHSLRPRQLHEGKNVLDRRTAVNDATADTQKVAAKCNIPFEVLSADSAEIPARRRGEIGRLRT